MYLHFDQYGSILPLCLPLPTCFFMTQTPGSPKKKKVGGLATKKTHSTGSKQKEKAAEAVKKATKVPTIKINDSGSKQCPCPQNQPESATLKDPIAFYFIHIALASEIQYSPLTDQFCIIQLAVLSAASLPGRLLPNIAADKWGPFNALLPCIGISGAMIFALYRTLKVGSMIAFVIIYGFFSGASNTGSKSP
ncbi:hypothetical protein D9758_016894 [Tetrapyrgos nigripes]|uniref:Uncharacterized protein n=1 Tax=Tetrapyrgos nigripes TaxID=182062 RepID=A0A8H5C446_9AGAR|nr:hypothetical protein D9758_016894 [Tetrapyrgos nigripes]